MRIIIKDWKSFHFFEKVTFVCRKVQPLSLTHTHTQTYYTHTLSLKHTHKHITHTLFLSNILHTQCLSQTHTQTHTLSLSHTQTYYTQYLSLTHTRSLSNILHTHTHSLSHTHVSSYLVTWSRRTTHSRFLRPLSYDSWTGGAPGVVPVANTLMLLLLLRSHVKQLCDIYPTPTPCDFRVYVMLSKQFY